MALGDIEIGKFYQRRYVPVVSPTVGLCTAGDSDIDNVLSDEEDVEEGGEPDEDDADSGDERGAAAKVCPCVLKLDASQALKTRD